MDDSPPPPPFHSAQDAERSSKTLISSTSQVTTSSDDLLPLTPQLKCISSEAPVAGGELSPSCSASDSAGPLPTDSAISGSLDPPFSHSFVNKEEQQQLLEDEDEGGCRWENFYKDSAGAPSSLASNGNWRPWPTCTDSFIKCDYSSRPSHSFSLDDDSAAYDRGFPDFKPLLSQGDSVGTDSKPSPPPLGAGLANMGNTCFLNAIFQCFTHTVPFVQGLFLLDQSIISHHDDDAEFCLLSAVRDHILVALSYPGITLFPCTLVNNLHNISSAFRRHEQEDAHEFLQCVLDKLDTCWSKYNPRAMSESSPGDTLVKQVFGGRLVSQLYCCNCDHCSETYEPLIDLSLEIEDVDDLDGALRSFTKVEEIEDADVKITCDSCKEKVPVKKQLMLDQAPSILTFHLKRFKSNGYFVEKIDKAVEYPLEMDLASFTVHNKSHNVELKYELYAVVVHNGWSSTSGHYFCYIRASSESWYEFDDSKVVDVPPEVALSQRAYILFYARKGTNWPCYLVEALRNNGLWNTSPKSVLEHVESTNLSSAFTDSSNTGESCDIKEEDSLLHCNEAVEVSKVGSSFTGEGGTSNEPSVRPSAIDETLKDDENFDEKINKIVEWGTSQHQYHGECNEAEFIATDVQMVGEKDSGASSSHRDTGGDKKICSRDASLVREDDLDSGRADGIMIRIDVVDKDTVATNGCDYGANGGDEKICKVDDELANSAQYHLPSPRTQRPDKFSKELQGSPRTPRPDKCSELQEARTVPACLRGPKKQSRMSLKQFKKRLNQKRKASRLSKPRLHVFGKPNNPGSLRKRRKS